MPGNEVLARKRFDIRTATGDGAPRGHRLSDMEILEMRRQIATETVCEMARAMGTWFTETSDHLTTADLLRILASRLDKENR